MDKDLNILTAGINSYLSEKDIDAREHLTKLVDTDSWARKEALLYLSVIEDLHGNESESKHYQSMMTDNYSVPMMDMYGDPCWAIGNQTWTIDGEWRAYEDEVQKCPKCRTIFIRHLGIKTFYPGVDEWSDGYKDEQYSPITPMMVKCPTCNRWYFISELRNIFSIAPDSYSELTIEIEYEDKTPLSDFKAALLQELDALEEITLRRRVMQFYNHPIRKGEKLDPTEDLLRRENLQRIINLSLKDEAPTLLLEAYLEIGDFSSAARLLEEKGKQLKTRREILYKVFQRAIAEKKTGPLIINEGNE